MKQTITESMFIDAFKQSSRADSFSYDGLKAMFEFFEQLDDGCGTEMELDVVAICCEFTEHNTLEDFWVDYDADEYPTIESIADHTTLIRIDDDSFIIQDF